MDSAVLEIRSGDQVLRTMKKRKLMPSEMERAVLTAKEIASLKEEVIIAVKEAA
jgi:hypothetical protein